jgi:hypothetical protein
MYRYADVQIADSWIVHILDVQISDVLMCRLFLECADMQTSNVQMICQDFKY